MPAATTKTELLSVTEKEFNKLQTELDNLPSELRNVPDGEDTTLKDIVGHRAHWIALFLGWYADGQTGKDVFFPAQGYKWNDLRRYNADLRAEQADLSWDAARALLNRNHRRLSAWISDHSETDLYGGPMKGAHNAWTPGRWAEAAGASHYRSATKYIRARVRAAQS